MNIKKTLIWALAPLFILILALFATNYYDRYKSWKNLSAETIIEKTSWYLENHASEPSSIEAVCLYIVACEDDRARLEITKDVKSIDFDSLRDRIWERRFTRTCKGRTSNLGLHILRNSSETSRNYSHSDHAIWSFYNNRFVPKLSRFSVVAFSEEPWERCSAQRAFYSVAE